MPELLSAIAKLSRHPNHMVRHAAAKAVVPFVVQKISAVRKFLHQKNVPSSQAVLATANYNEMHGDLLQLAYVLEANHKLVFDAIGERASEPPDGKDSIEAMTQSLNVLFHQCHWLCLHCTCPPVQQAALHLAHVVCAMSGGNRTLSQRLQTLCLEVGEGAEMGMPSVSHLTSQACTVQLYKACAVACGTTSSETGRVVGSTTLAAHSAKVR